MKNIRKITILSLLAIFFITVLSIILIQTNTALAYQAEMQTYKICMQYDDELRNLSHTPTVDEDFDDNEIIIILDSEHSGIKLRNSVYNFDEVVAELGKIDNIDINSVKELFDTEENEIVSDTYRRMLSLKTETSGKDNVIAAIEQLKKSDMILSAEPQYNYTFSEDWVPNDKLYSLQWGLNGTNGIHMEAAWDISKGSGVKVGLFEANIDASHEDLQGRVAQGNFTPAAGTDSAHGTHVGGIISAVSNDKGIAGISQATLYLLNKGTFESSLSFAADNDIKIINASFRYVVSETDNSPAPASSSHRQAIENYGSKGGLLVCSAGNYGVNSDNIPQYPAGYGDARLFPSVKNVISVGAINSSAQKASFSNYGTNSVQIYAPGDYIYSTLPNNAYGVKSGTSMATPHVTGVAALLLSADPNLAAAELKNIILSYADDITISTPDGNQNVKKLNAYKAVESLERKSFTVTLHQCNGTGWTSKISVAYGETMPTTYRAYAPGNSGHEFVGYFSGENGTGTQYYGMEIMTQPHLEWDYSYYEGMVPLKAWDKHSDGDLYAHYKLLECKYECSNVVVNEGFLKPTEVKLVHGGSVTITAKPIDGYKFSYFQYDGRKVDKSYEDIVYDKNNPSKLIWNNVELKRDDSTGEVIPKHHITIVYEKSCVAEGTLITLADGSRTAVENLTGDEMLLVWNLYTGTYDTAPILFIDSDPLQIYNVINLSFSDGTVVKVISEHGFWDYDLNKYVYLDSDAEKYIGHWFNKGDGRVQLVGVEIKDEYTTAWSPVTYGHLCYFVNGMLSMPGGIDGLFNIFDVDPVTMKYDEVSMQLDIQTYGLFTYEEFCEYFYMPEETFEAFNGQYMKVAIGKGLTTMERLSLLYEQYGNFLEN